MGMYDSLLIHPGLLPLSEEDLKQITEGENWQSKSLDCSLDVYTIDSTGQLLGFNRFKKDFFPMLYDGVINFYSDIDHNSNDGWREFNATFKNGLLTTITRVL